jgi:hypothetical protein
LEPSQLKSPLAGLFAGQHGLTLEGSLISSGMHVHLVQLYTSFFLSPDQFKVQTPGKVRNQSIEQMQVMTFCGRCQAQNF